MADKTVSINSFKYGLDTRREALASLPGTLLQATNCAIDSGGEIIKRKGFFALDSAHLSLPAGCFGLQDTDVGLMTFGNQSTPAGLPAGVTYQQLAYPTSPGPGQMSAVIFSCCYLGKPFVLVSFDNTDAIFAYYNGQVVFQITDGVIKPSPGGGGVPETPSDLSRDLAAIVNRVVDTNDLGNLGWLADANVTVNPLAGVVTPVSPTYNGSMQDTANVTTGSLYSWTPGVNEVSLVNGSTTLTGAGYFVAQNALVTFSSANPGVPYTGKLQLTNSYNEVALAGSTLVMSPIGIHFTPDVTHNNSAAGLIGAKLIDQNYPGVAAIAAFVVFTLNVGTNGTVDVQSGALDLTGGAVSFNTSLSQTATNIVNAINNNTFFTGYSANNVGAVITVYAPISLGNYTGNLTIITTGDITTTNTGTPYSQLVLSLTPSNLNVDFKPISSPGVVGGVVVATVTGSTLPITYTWTEVNPTTKSSIGDIVFTTNGTAYGAAVSPITGPKCGFFSILNGGASIVREFQCRASDGVHADAVVTFFVTLTAINQ